ncbi:Golgi GDP-mannose transporter [Microthyrium microscopicum]|uniref:GDP-mannose transporter n=1 Tax=Microthyrium microscopicum TaxID=703497 RepID=A0A6A6UC75_9PEZI|nr:Golgi GDP-mannose transporter [Microthyrium microscopicum]
MSDEKKRDDFAIDLGERRADKFDALPRSMPQTPQLSAPLVSPANQGLLSILSYCASSILMTTTNKYVLGGLDYNLNFLLLAVQSIVCVAAIQTLKSASVINYRDFNTDEARKWFPISLLLIGMIYTSTWALKFLSIPVYTIFKNLTIPLIAYGEVLWFGGTVTPIALFSFGLMVFSSIVAAWADIQHALSTMGEAHTQVSTLNTGYVWMFANCFCTAAYVLCMRKRIKLTNFKDFDTMYYNNLLTIPILVIASITLEDWSSANLAKNFPPANRTSIYLAMLFSGLSSVFISYTSAWCVRVTSSTTYSMVGALNKLPIAVSGLVFFDAPCTLGSVSAIAIGFVSGIVYAWAKMVQSGKSLVNRSTTVVSASSQSHNQSMK